ncbi:beta-galactosidase [Neobacillus sp. 179-J 1A1 HS]|uniref:beta-galactosidase n=1 Tax=Neobacillus driksii TaxID=3035913 RepID=UPI0035BC1F10
MSVQDKIKTVVQLSKEGIEINGKPTVILCASLFYFRIPRELWKNRLLKVKKAGYNSIDVYFPWNFHETEQNNWDFSGEKDVEAFLQMAAEEGLYVVARPGPYICSEWDGGALPSYLFSDANIRLRDNDPVFLEHVNRWFDQILPILKRFELGQQGTIICVQLDNELDFYGCQDPNGYISALRDMALAKNLEVPLIACAGQGDLFLASGNSDGVIPACNLYPNDRDPEFEAKVHAYVDTLSSENIPLMVTETNRSHFLLRRLLAGGAKLLGPYLQVSGTNFGFTNAANNWGDPLALLTSDYDFGGMISSTGEVRPEAYEGRLMSRVIQAAGDSLALSSYTNDHGFSLSGASSYEVTGPNVLQLYGGGYLYSLPNVSNQEQTVAIHLEGNTFPEHTKLTIPEGCCPLLLAQTPLSHWGVPEGKVEFATAELIYAQTQGDQTYFVFSGQGESELSLSFPNLLEVETNGDLQLKQEGERITLTAQRNAAGSAKIILTTGQNLTINLLQREQALRLKEVLVDGQLIFDELSTQPIEKEIPQIEWSVAALKNGAPELGGNSQQLGSDAELLENRGVYKGYSWYKAKFISPESKGVSGVLLQNASDICSVYTDDQYHGTVVPGGGSYYIPFEAEKASREMKLLVRSEIWGHSNFDDARLPAFRLKGQKGLTGAVAVTDIVKLNSNWRFKEVRSSNEHHSYTSLSCDTKSWPLISWSSWMTEHHPSYGYYRKSFSPSAHSNTWVLHLPGIKSLVTVFINGNEAGKVNPLNPYIDLTQWIRGGEETQLTLFLETYYGLSAGNVLLYEGVKAVDWELTSADEVDLWNQAVKAKSLATSTELPVELVSGSSAWLFGNLDVIDSTSCWKVLCSGSNCKLTFYLNGRLLGRIWNPSKTSRPQMRGGNDQLTFIPGPWIHKKGNTFAILLESTEQCESGIIEEIRFLPVIDEWKSR